ncbi:MAG: hypothetical protein LAO03_18010 [Acidobacteriia bacterium]|nr:hypothetical protein [Terriglobia bacterium]
MNHGRVLYHLVKADFLERVRRYSFLLTLAGALYLAYAVLEEKAQLQVGQGYRGIYNSAWVGALMTVTASVFLTLVGFYIVKNSLQRDVQTRVGQILATTPMRKSFYTVAKMISNFTVLAAMVVVLMLAALGMQYLRAEDLHLSLWKLWSPFVLVALPAMAVTAAVAILFETLPLLRGGFGNVAYFFVWTFALASAVIGADDFAGMHVFYDSMGTALRKIDPQSGPSFNFTIGNQRPYRTFTWNGVDWTAHAVLLRLAWVAVAVGIALVASVFFHRFDPAREFSLWKQKAQNAGANGNGEAERVAVGDIHASVVLTPLQRSAIHGRFGQMVVSELRLMLKGLRWWWYVVAAGLSIASLVSPAAATRQGVLIVAWLWPVLVWSKMGARETQHATQSLIFSSPRALYRQLPALWTAGILVAILTGGGVGIRLLLGQDWHALAAWIGGALFIPTLALALGVWSGSSKPFEALYTVWWYVGPAHYTPGLDFMGLTPQSANAPVYLLATIGLLAAAYWGRRVQAQTA